MRRFPVVPAPTLGGKQLWADEAVRAGWRIQRNVLTGHHRLLDERDVRRAAGDFEHCWASLERRRLGAASEHAVVLLHGLFRSKDALAPMARGLRAEGFEILDVNYPSTRADVMAHASQVERVLERATAARVSFVTHSLGGIVARVVLGRDAAWRERIAVNRLVMIGTPNQGSEVARALTAWPPVRWVAGPALSELTPERRDAIPRPAVPFGIVSGSRGDGRGFNPWLEGDDDLTVSVASTWLEGAEDWLVVPAVHTFVMASPAVIAATARYLKTGRFAG